MLVLRFAHVFFGALWVGMMAFQTFFLMPALAEAGPDGGKLLAAVMRRRIPVILPIVALITLVSGFSLFQRLSGGAAAGLLRTPMGLAFGSGGAAALLAFLLGIVVMRPAMMRSAALGASLPSASPEERAKISAELQRLRARGAMTGWVGRSGTAVQLAGPERPWLRRRSGDGTARRSQRRRFVQRRAGVRISVG